MLCYAVCSEAHVVFNPGEGARRYSSILRDEAAGGATAPAPLNTVLPSNGSSLLQSASGWTPDADDAEPWLQFDLGTPQVVAGAVLQKHAPPRQDESVTGYELLVHRAAGGGSAGLDT
jgi:hypothetical protein